MSDPGSGVNQRDYALSWQFLVSYDGVARLGQGGSNPWIQVFYGFYQTAFTVPGVDSESQID